MQTRANVISSPVATSTVAPIQLPWTQQFGLLLRLLVTDIRSAAPFLVIMGVILPLGLFWIMSQYVGTGPESLWLLAGNVVMTVSFGSGSFSIQRTALMKIEGELDYYGSLSVRKSAFIAAVFTESILFSIPALTSSLIIGNLLMNVAWSNLIVVAPIAILAGSILTIVGSTIGSYAKHMGHFAVLSYLPYLAVTFFSPVLLPIEKMPIVFRIFSYLLPTGEASLVLVEVLHGRYGTDFWIFTGALCLWLVFALLVASRRLDWKTD